MHSSIWFHFRSIPCGNGFLFFSIPSLNQTPYSDNKFCYHCTPLHDSISFPYHDLNKNALVFLDIFWSTFIWKMKLILSFVELVLQRIGMPKYHDLVCSFHYVYWSVHQLFDNISTSYRVVCSCECNGNSDSTHELYVSQILVFQGLKVAGFTKHFCECDDMAFWILSSGVDSVILYTQYSLTVKVAGSCLVFELFAA